MKRTEVQAPTSIVVALAALARVTERLEKAVSAVSALRLPSEAASSRPLASATYLTVPQAVDYLSFCSPAAFYMWVGRQQIPKCRTGRRLLFLRRDLDEAVQGRGTGRRPR